MSGFIKIHRKILKWEWWDDVPTRNIFFYLLIKANFEDKTWKKLVVKRGQLITSVAKIAKECGLSAQQTRRALNNMQNTNEITNKTTNRYSLIEIKNYDSYQQNNKQTTNHRTNKEQATEQQLKKKEIKNKENIKEKFEDFVFLTETEISTLKNRYGENKTKDYIIRLNNYLGSTGKKYKSHYHTILNWMNKEPQQKEKVFRNLNDL